MVDKPWTFISGWFLKVRRLLVDSSASSPEASHRDFKTSQDLQVSHWDWWNMIYMQTCFTKMCIIRCFACTVVCILMDCCRFGWRVAHRGPYSFLGPMFCCCDHISVVLALLQPNAEGNYIGNKLNQSHFALLCFATKSDWWTQLHNRTVKSFWAGEALDSVDSVDLRFLTIFLTRNDMLERHTYQGKDG